MGENRISNHMRLLLHSHQSNITGESWWKFWILCINTGSRGSKTSPTQKFKKNNNNQLYLYEWSKNMNYLILPLTSQDHLNQKEKRESRIMDWELTTTLEPQATSFDPAAQVTQYIKRMDWSWKYIKNDLKLSPLWWSRGKLLRLWNVECVALSLNFIIKGPRRRNDFHV